MVAIWICLIIFTAVLLYLTVTPVTLAAMTLERYVAICMPLRHGQLCSTQNTVNIILLIHAISSVPGILILSAFFVSASLSFYRQYQFCSVEIFMLYIWQHNLRSGIYQVQFLIMVIIIVFSYIKIMKVAKAASGEDKQSSRKGLRTVALHGFQLLLCLIQLWCPFIEVAILQIDVGLFKIARYLNFLLFYLAPRCLSPLIYGLRDEVFFQALKYYASFGLLKRNI
ncbi:odorant receptor 131-2-like [Echeneis naucrates]|uniref:odorant receptor 131-2-like n=1 Tax=Echeneis naucrates TaxID=173247 RepID=UPI0011141906|nr:odorant receptor 131-2-like [Echeneis naucrates]